MTQAETTEKLSRGNTSMEDLEAKLKEVLRSSSSKEDFTFKCNDMFNNPAITFRSWEGEHRSVIICCHGYSEKIKASI